MKMNSVLLISFFSAAAFFGCASAPATDAHLLRPYTQAFANAEPLQAPYIADYNKEAWHLRYIAANHESGASQPTEKTIRESFAKFAPELVIIEGFEKEIEVSPKKLKETGQASCQNLQSPICTEAAYAAYLAQASMIDFTGAEPSDQKILFAMQDQGYSAEDLIAFFVVRRVPQWRREQALEKSTIKDLADKLIAHYADIYQEQARLDYEGFTDWYEYHLHKKFNVDKITAADTAPLTNENATILNQLASRVDWFREQKLLEVLNASLQTNKKVMVIYGSSHLVEDREALEKAFGPPVNQKLF